jgi:hypothetical protein
LRGHRCIGGRARRRIMCLHTGGPPSPLLIRPRVSPGEQRQLKSVDTCLRTRGNPLALRTTRAYGSAKTDLNQRCDQTNQIATSAMLINEIALYSALTERTF